MRMRMRMRFDATFAAMHHDKSKNEDHDEKGRVRATPRDYVHVSTWPVPARVGSRKLVNVPVRYQRYQARPHLEMN